MLQLTPYLLVTLFARVFFYLDSHVIPYYISVYNHVILMTHCPLESMWPFDNIMDSITDTPHKSCTYSML